MGRFQKRLVILRAVAKFFFFWAGWAGWPYKYSRLSPYPLPLFFFFFPLPVSISHHHHPPTQTLFSTTMLKKTSAKSSTYSGSPESVLTGKMTLKGALYLDLVTFRDPDAPPPVEDDADGSATAASPPTPRSSYPTPTSSRSSTTARSGAGASSWSQSTAASRERDYEEEYFFLVPVGARAQDTGGLLHIVGSGTPRIYLTVTPGVCPMKNKNYVRRQNIGVVAGESQFLAVAAHAPLCVTRANPKIDKAIYSRWKQDMIHKAVQLGVLTQ